MLPTIPSARALITLITLITLTRARSAPRPPVTGDPSPIVPISLLCRNSNATEEPNVQIYWSRIPWLAVPGLVVGGPLYLWGHNEQTTGVDCGGETMQPGDSCAYSGGGGQTYEQATHYHHALGTVLVDMGVAIMAVAVICAIGSALNRGRPPGSGTLLRSAAKALADRL